jgi:hypothetical protein
MIFSLKNRAIGGNFMSMYRNENEGFAVIRAAEGNSVDLGIAGQAMAGDVRISALILTINGNPCFSPTANLPGNLREPQINLQSQVENRANGMARVRIAEFANALNDGEKAERTYNGYASNVRSVLRKVAKMFFGNIKPEDVDLSKVTKEQIQEVQREIYSGGDFMPASLFRIKHGWNCFCAFVGMDEWKFTRKNNATEAPKADVIENEDVLKILEHCRKMREEATTEKARIRWLRREVAIRIR